MEELSLEEMAKLAEKAVSWHGSSQDNRLVGKVGEFLVELVPHYSFLGLGKLKTCEINVLHNELSYNDYLGYFRGVEVLPIYEIAVKRYEEGLESKRKKKKQVLQEATERARSLIE